MMEMNRVVTLEFSLGIFHWMLPIVQTTKWNTSRSGLCGIRFKKFDGSIDLDPYDTISLKIKGDGRSYISTIYTENCINSSGQMEDNSWQAFVSVHKHIWIPLAHYLRTWRGNVIEADIEMNPSRVVGMSFYVNAEGGVPGAQTVKIDWITALRTQ
ncbi:unnamed protein product [Lactuca saligna]|uniref:NADH:ubiquinone oxidoreductase intermediate-associated protein 30 domain-containing protein n=1 Tax=Lactuca saligna TaxID=75948 RepID=A0AA35YVN3_LACSI|nr:unnamed protein product [Lactuca saligna]